MNIKHINVAQVNFTYEQFLKKTLQCIQLSALQK